MRGLTYLVPVTLVILVTVGLVWGLATSTLDGGKVTTTKFKISKTKSQ